MAEFELEEVQTYLILAEEKLVVARDLLSLGHYRDVVAKAYYTMFYAAKAALLTAGAGGVRRRVARRSRQLARGGGQRRAPYGLHTRGYGRGTRCVASDWRA